jgi:hypothetical protein
VNDSQASRVASALRTIQERGGRIADELDTRRSELDRATQDVQSIGGRMSSEMVDNLEDALKRLGRAQQSLGMLSRTIDDYLPQLEGAAAASPPAQMGYRTLKFRESATQGGKPAYKPPVKGPVSEPELTWVPKDTHGHGANPKGGEFEYEFSGGFEVPLSNGGKLTVEAGVGDEAEVGKVRQQIEKHLAGLPDGPRKAITRVRVYGGTNPADPHWRADPGYSDNHTSAATAGDGTINFWTPTEKSHTWTSQRIFDHEAAHAMTAGGGPPSGEASWDKAQFHDIGHAKGYEGQTITFDDELGDIPQPGYERGGFPGVTDYAASSISEDWAESVRLVMYEQRKGHDGKKGIGQRADGTRVTFEDLYPGRMAIVREHFLQTPGGVP